jgi:D-glycero-D-manno-heptose 1,7-bisphosphate phosphatase
VPVIVVTNQSGIARGLLTVRDYAAVRARLDELLAAEGAHLLDSYMCPHHPDMTGPCECRKPGTLLYRQAAAAHDLDLARSFFIGDRWHDASPARAFGARGILVAGPDTPPIEEERAEREGLEVVGTLAEAVAVVLGGK